MRPRHDRRAELRGDRADQPGPARYRAEHCDADAVGAGDATLSVLSGTLNVNAAAAASRRRSGTGNVTLTGTLAEINDLLAGNFAATVGYVINSDAPPASDTLTLSVDDGGNTGRAARRLHRPASPSTSPRQRRATGAW